MRPVYVNVYCCTSRFVSHTLPSQGITVRPISLSIEQRDDKRPTIPKLIDNINIGRGLHCQIVQVIYFKRTEFMNRFLFLCVRMRRRLSLDPALAVTLID